MSELWNELDEEDICCECGNYPVKYQCKICFEPLCRICSHRHHGMCTDCEDEVEEKYDNKDNW